MSVVSALVLLAVIWFLTLFVVLPIRLETQGQRQAFDLMAVDILLGFQLYQA